MKIGTAFKNAWKAYGKSPLNTVKFLLTEGCVVVACLAPLLFLTAGNFPLGVILTPVLFILLLLPARVNAAASMKNALTGGALFGQELISFEDYGKKLVCGLKRLVFVLIWWAPMLASLWLIRENVAGDTDALTLMRTIKKQFGGGELVRGVKVLALIFLATVILALLGLAFHSGARHAFVHKLKSLSFGNHMKLILANIAALVCVLPLLIAVGMAVVRYLPVLGDLNGLFMGSVNLPDTKGTLVILAVGGVLTVPFLPLRSLITADCVRQIAESKA